MIVPMQSMETKLDIDADEPMLSTQSRTPSDIHQLSPVAIHRNGVNECDVDDLLTVHIHPSFANSDITGPLDQDLGHSTKQERVILAVANDRNND